MDEETKKQAYKYINAFQKENYDRINLLVPKGAKEKYAAMAKERGMSISEFFRYAADKLKDTE